MERIFQVCCHCGSWRETTKAQRHPLGQMFVDYDHRFFLEEHLQCPYPPKSPNARYGIFALRDSDPGFKPPDPAKEWKPENCPQYRPRRRRSVRTRRNLAEEDLLGWWVTNNIGGFEDEAWGFRASGVGILAPIKLGDIRQFSFKWKLKPDRKLWLQGSGWGKSPGFLFFEEGNLTIKVTDEINEYGEKNQFLTVQTRRGQIRLTKKPDDLLKQLIEIRKLFR